MARKKTDQTINNNITIYSNDLEMYIDEFCIKYNIDDLAQETQNRFNACMIYINNNYIKPNNILKHKPNINNQYNYTALKELLYIYIDLCYLYSKECSISGFEKLSGCTQLYEWAKDASHPGYDIYKKIMLENERSNSDLLTSGKNPVGVMARLNHVHNWSAQEKAAQVTAVNTAITDTKQAFLSFLDGQKRDRIE